MKRTFAIWMIISMTAFAPAKAQNYLAYLDKKTAQQTSASNIVFPLSDFTVVINQNKPHLYWQTGASSDYNYFEVQRSEDGQNFKTIAIFFAKEDAKPHELYNYKDVRLRPTVSRFPTVSKLWIRKENLCLPKQKKCRTRLRMPASG